MHRKLITWSVIPLCLFLISLEIRVPNLAGFHSPKPHPRAVIETTAKGGKEAGTRTGIAVEAPKNLLNLNIPAPFRSSFPHVAHKFNSISIVHIGARAPPATSV